MPMLSSYSVNPVESYPMSDPTWGSAQRTTPIVYVQLADFVSNSGTEAWLKF